MICSDVISTIYIFEHIFQYKKGLLGFLTIISYSLFGIIWQKCDFKTKSIKFGPIVTKS